MSTRKSKKRTSTKKKPSRKKKISLRNSLKVTTFSTFIGLVVYFFSWVGLQGPQTVLPGSDQPPIFYSNQAQDDLRNTFVSAINDAKQSILLMIYSLTDTQVIEALKKRADQGVKITVIHDPDTAQWGFEKLGKKITCIEKASSGLMHRKILVVDKEKIWIGSANLTSESLRQHDNLVIGLASKNLAERIADSNCYLTPGLLAQPPPLYEIGGQNIEFWYLPEQKDQAFKRVLALIEGAQKTLKVAMFTWTHPLLTEAVIKAHRRGVKVDVVIDHQSGMGVSALTVEKLAQAGIDVGLNSGKGLLHHKFAFIDGKTLINGSANWTKAAFSKNEDCFLVLHNLTTDQIEKMDKIWHVIRCEKLTLRS